MFSNRAVDNDAVSFSLCSVYFALTFHFHYDFPPPLLLPSAV